MSASSITNPNRQKLAFLVLKHRLKMELRFKELRGTNQGRATMGAVRLWGLEARTRKEALKLVTKWLEENEA